MVRSVIIFLVLTTFLLTIQSAGLQAQTPGEGSVGITASLQGQQLDIQVPYWVSDNLVLAPLFGFQNVQDNFTRLRLGIKPKFYQTIGNNFGSYFTGLLVFDHMDPNAGDSEASVNLGGGFGGEYFFSPHFSMGVEGLLNIRLADLNSFSTGAALTGTVYF